MIFKGQLTPSSNLTTQVSIFNSYFLTMLFSPGQEIYYTTHSFFLSERSIFVVVWNLCDETNFTKQLNYWMNSIRVHAPKAPIVLVGTHLDGRKGTRVETEEYMRNIFKKFKKEFPRVRAFHGVSCSTGRGIEELLRSLEVIALAEPYVTQPVPVAHTIFEAFLLMERNVYEQVGLQPILTWAGPFASAVPDALPSDTHRNLLPAEITSIASKCRVIPSAILKTQEDEDELRAALNYAHLLGSIYYYHAEDPSKRLVILDPQWIAKMFSSIVTTKHFFASKGIIPVKVLNDQVWRDYPIETHQSIMELFETFEVMFRLPASVAGLAQDQGDIVIIPSTLPIYRPEDLAILWPTLEHSKSAYSRHYKFEFIPNGLFSRYMVRLTRLGTVVRYWQTGVLIQHPRKAALALVELKASANLLQISVRGTDSTSTDMFCTMVELLEFLLVNWFRVQTDIAYIEPRSHAVFSQQQLEEASLSGSWILEADVTDDATSMVQMSHVVKVKMDAVAPELALNNLQALELDIENDLRLLQEIGEGAYATVYKATLLATNETVAVKRLNMLSSDYTDNADIKAAFNEFRREVMVMSELKHPNIVKLIGFSLQVPFSMVMELAAHDALHKFLTTHPKLGWDWRLRVASDIAEALTFLHSIDYQHRDLKSPNILIASEDPYAPSVAKVSDFGITGRMYAQQSKAKLSENREVQNPTWLAPEVLRGEGTTPASDVYAFGIILWELATQQHPFGEFDYKFTIDLEEAIKHGTRPTIPVDCNPALAALIADCWNPTQKSRPTFSQITSQRLPEVMKQLVPNLAAKIQELKKQATQLLERQRSELESALASQKQQIKHLEELRDKQLQQQDSSDENTSTEDDGDGPTSEDADDMDGDDDSDTESTRSSPRTIPRKETAPKGTVTTGASPRENTSLTSSGLSDSSASVDSSSGTGTSKRTKGSRKSKSNRTESMTSSVAAVGLADLAGAPFAAPTAPEDQGLDSASQSDSSKSKGSVSGMIRGAVTKLKKISSASFGTAGDSTLGSESSRGQSAATLPADSIQNNDSPVSRVGSGGGRGSKPGMLQSTNSTLGGILNDLFTRTTGNGVTRVSLGGYWRMMEGELRDLLDQRGLLLDPSAPQTKADLVQVLVDDDAAIAKMRITGMSSQSSENLLTPRRPSSSPMSPGGSAATSVKGSAGTSLAMQFDAREVNEKTSAISSSFLASALWRRVKYYVTVSNAVYDLRGEPLQAISLRDSSAQLVKSTSSSTTSSGSRGRERSGTVGGGPLPNAGGVEVQYGLDPLVELLIGAPDEKTKWNVLASISVLLDQPIARKQLVDSGLTQILVSMLVDLVKNRGSKHTSPGDVDREERVARRTSRLRSVIMAMLANLTSTAPLLDTEGAPVPLPPCLTRETELRLFIRLMRHTYDELKQMERRENSPSRSGHSDAVVAAPSFPGSASSVRAELVATLALLANVTSWSDGVADLIATSDTIAREITRGDSNASASSATVDLFTLLLDDAATTSAAATILTNISAKDERLCALVATRSLVRKCTRALRRSPPPPDDTVLTVACLLRNCSSIPTMCRYMASEQVTEALNDLPFNAAVDSIFRTIIQNVHDNSPQAAMRRKKSLTKKFGEEFTESAEPLKKHEFVKYSFKSFHWCMYCTKFVWGIRNQGQRCTVCHYSAHEACVKHVDTPCPGYVVTQNKEPPTPGSSPTQSTSFRK